MARIEHRFAGEDYEEIVSGLQLKHKDYFSLRQMYILMHEWLIEEGYATRKDMVFPERLYLLRQTQKGGDETWIWWRLEKVPTGNSYYKYVFDINLHVILLKDTEVVHNNIKYKTNWGEPEIKIWGKIIGDYKHTWKNHWFLKHVQSLFMQRFFNTSFMMHRKEFYRDIYRFHEALKAFFKLRTYLPEAENQHFYMDKDFG